MSKVLDFKPRYANKALSLDPAFSASGGLGWAIINLDAELFGGVQNIPHIHRCGLIKPFSTDSNLNTMNELCLKVVDIWRNDSGYSVEPSLLVVELPVIYPNLHIKPSSIRDLILFAGMLTQTLQPKMQLTPTTGDWKGNQTKEKTQQLIIESLDFHSQRALKRDLESIALDQRHNVFDAIGLGIYGARVFKEQNPLPKMHYRKKA